jgi:predicted alpha/beta hydrolase family esterase
MTKTVYIIHRWWGDPTCDWIPWLRSELEKRGIAVVVPEMPDSGNPKIGTWVPALKNIVARPDRDVYFVGHSVGCQTILRYVESLPPGRPVGGVLLVAPWISTLTNLSEEEKQISRPWLETPIAWDRIRAHTSKITVIYSDNDPYVPVGEALMLKEMLDARLLLDPGKGHFSDDDRVTRLPSALEALSGIMEQKKS